MSMEGSIVHTKCGGTGFTTIDDGSIDVCVECMGSGRVHIGINVGDHPNWIREIDESRD